MGTTRSLDMCGRGSYTYELNSNYSRVKVQQIMFDQVFRQKLINNS